MKNNINKMWCNKTKTLSLFNSSLKEYGGFNHFLAHKIFRSKYRYLDITLKKSFKFINIHENKEMYYDGFHNVLQIGFIYINYGT